MIRDDERFLQSNPSEYSFVKTQKQTKKEGGLIQYFQPWAITKNPFHSTHLAPYTFLSA